MTTAVAAVLAFQALNSLSQAEIDAGWKLLFDGKTTTGWHNFKSKEVGPGWKVEGGILTSVDPATAGDIMTSEQFDWFELSIEFRLTPGGNSGIMYRVVEEGEATWHSGPEVQIYDAQGAQGAQISGWLYQLYSSEVDATKPVGEWNHYRIVVSPEKCSTAVNGTLYYEYQLGSDDFWERVKKSKFAEFPMFAKAPKGSIAIQGDHGVVSFRNIKIRPIKAT